MSTSTGHRQEKNHHLAFKLAGVAVLFAGLGFAMVPLYDVICRVTGINGKTNGTAVAAPTNTQVDTSRWVTVEFLGHAMPGVGLQLKPETFSMRVHPGEVIHTNYTVTNLTQDAFVGQAVPSVTPAVAAPSFQKIECFCFSQQAFQGKETRTLPVVFYVKPDIDPELGTITLSYTFFEAVKDQAATTESNHPSKKL